MLSNIAAFELRYQLRSPLFVVSFLLFALLAFAATTMDGVQIGGRGNVHLNSPYAILQTLGVMNIFAIFVVTAFVANVVIRDDETGFAPLMRATRIRKFDYLVGRFSGATLVAFLVTLATPLGILIGSFMPWLDAEKLGPLALSHYAFAAFCFGLPSLLVLAAGFFALATATRSLMWSYVGVVAFLVLYTASRVMLADARFDHISALTDPFGMAALSKVTKYWTAAERNTQLPALEGVLLYNRLIWLGVSAALFALAYGLFRFELRSKPSSASDSSGTADPRPAAKPLALPQFGRMSHWQQFAALTRFDMGSVFKSPAFFVLLALGLFNAYGSLTLTTEMRGGIPMFPVTRAVVEALSGSFTIIPIIIAIFYGGELVWRDRERRIHEIVDATAAPSWAFIVPKVLAISLVLLSTFVAAGLVGAGFQLLNGFTDIAVRDYLLWFILPNVITAVLLAILSITVQALVPNKFSGWAVMLVYVVLSVSLTSAGWEHNLYNFAGTPQVPLSDMNGLGHFWIGRAWFQAYWLLFGLILLLITQLMWRRGAETRLKPRFVLLLQGLKGRAGVALALLGLAFVACGSWIFYNTNVLNEYRTRPEREQLQADYEKTLLSVQDLPQPTITHVNLQVALFPHEVRADTEGSYDIENRSSQPIDTLHVQWNRQLQMQQLDLPGATLDKEYPQFSHRVYRLVPAIQPGEHRLLKFRTRLEERGFVNDGPFTRIVANGSFVNNMEISPRLGIDTGFFLADRAKRRKHGLPAERPMAKLEDEAARAHHDLRQDSDWVTADICLSTEADQTPLAPGYTVSDSTSQGRRTLVTRTEAPIHNFFSLQSAHYAVKSEAWTNVDGKPVALSVYHHPVHAHNVQRMLDAMKASLALFSDIFSPYQFRQARILEFPAYASFAQSFANTVHYSEGIGFIQNFKDEDQDSKIDLVTYVTAHEMGHQWWGHQVVGADKQGGAMLMETFAQYSALRVMETLYGKPQLRKFLKRELDGYLRARGADVVDELPLARVERQPHIYYQKGALVMYGLKDIVGEGPVDRAMRQMVDRYAFKAAPYPDTRDFLKLLRAEVGPEHQQLITDLFERITLYDLKAVSAEASKRAEGGYELRLTVQAKKLYADGKGQETEAPLNEAVDVGAFSVEPGKKGYSTASMLKLERQPLHSGTQVLTMIVDQLPKFAGVDPFNVRIDRNSDDNLVPVTVK